MEQSGPRNGVLHVHTPIDTPRHIHLSHEEFYFQQTHKMRCNLTDHHI